MNIVHEIIQRLTQRIRHENLKRRDGPWITEMIVTRAEADALRKALDDRYQEELEEARSLGFTEPHLPWATERGNSLFHGVEIIGR